MSGGVSDVRAKDLHFFNSYVGLTIKTSPGRGGYVKNVFISEVTMSNVDVAIKFNGRFGEHPDDKYNPDALPLIEMITIKNVTGKNVKNAGFLEGIDGDNFTNICLSDVTLHSTSESPWKCSYVGGFSDSVYPDICEPLKRNIFPEHLSSCYNLSNHLWNMSNPSRGAWLEAW